LNIYTIPVNSKTSRARGKQDEGTDEFCFINTHGAVFTYFSPAGSGSITGDSKAGFLPFQPENLKRRPLRRSKRRRKVINMGLKEMGCLWIRLAQDSNQWRVLMNTVMNLRVSRKARNFLTS
jgi:hypothetical protein